MVKRDTYPVYVVKQIVPVTGWQAVYWIEEEQKHVCEAVHLIGLAHIRTYARKSGRKIVEDNTPEDECWTVVGLQSESGGRFFGVLNEVHNFCGLLQPGEDAQVFIDGCHHKQETR
jgi:hypothetical protein